MLLQHLQPAEPIVEAVIAFNLVDLAFCAPENAFVDIIRAFLAINTTRGCQTTWCVSVPKRFIT